MTNLQRIKSVAKANGLEFTRKSATINGAQLYDFVCKNTGYAVAENWTVSSAINEYNHGDLESKLI